MQYPNVWKQLILAFRYRQNPFYLILITAFLFIQCGTNNDPGSEEKHTWQSGDVYKDEQGWIEARAGNMPLVISAPHGGTLKPEAITDRSCSGIVTVRDMNTIELALQMEQKLFKYYDIQPFTVLNHLHRSKLDMNRDIEEATCDNESGEAPWQQYHKYIEGALSAAIDEFGYAVFIDLHGHGHDKQRLELGYLLTKDELRNSYYDENTAADLSGKSSLGNLLVMNSKLDFQELLTGKQAFGTMMENEGIAAVPSKQDLYPQKGDRYFTGGYNTRRYTSTSYPEVFGWQIEANFEGVRSSKKDRREFAASFAKAMMNYLENNLKFNTEQKVINSSESK